VSERGGHGSTLPSDQDEHVVFADFVRPMRTTFTVSPFLSGETTFVAGTSPGTGRCPIISLGLDFHFHNLLDNLLTSFDAFIMRGSNVMKTLRRSAPNG